jgi:RNA polymerase sigma-70 factor (ECF subfamily)
MIEPDQRRGNRDARGSDDPWVAAFHQGQRHVLAELYLAHFATVAAAVGRVLRGADRETCVHEVFFKLISSSEQRQRFRGGSFDAWITTVARNHAIDYARRLGRERTVPSDELERRVGSHDGLDEDTWARVLVERFRGELPEAWRPVFDLCFVAQMPQRTAAAQLGIARTTLAYQYHRVRRRLRQFLVSRTAPRKETT